MNITFKQDKRSIKTRDRIKKALAILLKSQKQSEIMIVDITSLAKISRNSFYTHYQTIQDVFKDICLDVCKVFDDCINKYDYYEFIENPSPLLKELTNTCITNSAFNEYVIFSKQSNYIIQGLIDYLTDKFYKMYLYYRGDENQIVPYMTNFLVAGSVEVLYKWYKEGKSVDFEIVISNVTKIIRDGIVMLREVKNSKN